MKKLLDEMQMRRKSNSHTISLIRKIQTVEDFNRNKKYFKHSIEQKYLINTQLKIHKFKNYLKFNSAFKNYIHDI